MQKTLFLFFLFLITGLALAQVKSADVQTDSLNLEKTLTIDKELMQSIKEKDEFDYNRSYTEETWWSNFTSWLNKKWNQLLQAIFGDIKPDTFVYFLTQILPYLIVGGVIIFIIWLFIKLNPGQNVLAKTEQSEVFFSNEEELVKTKNLAKLKEEALKKQNFRLAVRYWYLLILQNLDKLELIEYEFEKTNTDYANELQSKSFVGLFKESTNYYNFAWYGGFEVNEIQFQKIDRLFSHLQTQINQKNG